MLKTLLEKPMIQFFRDFLTINQLLDRKVVVYFLSHLNTTPIPSSRDDCVWPKVAPTRLGSSRSSTITRLCLYQICSSRSSCICSSYRFTDKCLSVLVFARIDLSSDTTQRYMKKKKMFMEDCPCKASTDGHFACSNVSVSTYESLITALTLIHTILLITLLLRYVSIRVY